ARLQTRPTLAFSRPCSATTSTNAESRRRRCISATCPPWRVTSAEPACLCERTLHLDQCHCRRTSSSLFALLVLAGLLCLVLGATGGSDRRRLANHHSVLCGERGGHLQHAGTQISVGGKRRVPALRQLQLERADWDVRDRVECAAGDSCRVDEGFPVQLNRDSIPGEHDHEFGELRAAVTNEI